MSRLTSEQRIELARLHRVRVETLMASGKSLCWTGIFEGLKADVQQATRRDRVHTPGG